MEPDENLDITINDEGNGFHYERINDKWKFIQYDNYAEHIVYSGNIVASGAHHVTDYGHAYTRHDFLLIGTPIVLMLLVFICLRALGFRVVRTATEDKK